MGAAGGGFGLFLLCLRRFLRGLCGSRLGCTTRMGLGEANLGFGARLCELGCWPGYSLLGWLMDWARLAWIPHWM